MVSSRRDGSCPLKGLRRQGNAFVQRTQTRPNRGGASKMKTAASWEWDSPVFRPYRRDAGRATMPLDRGASRHCLTWERGRPRPHLPTPRPSGRVGCAPMSLPGIARGLTSTTGGSARMRPWTVSSRSWRWLSKTPSICDRGPIPHPRSSRQGHVRSSTSNAIEYDAVPPNRVLRCSY